MDLLFDKVAGSLVGLAVGDALGTPLKDIGSIPKKQKAKPVFLRTHVKFGTVTDMHGGGPFNLEPGEWSNETSMALALSDSLVSCNGFNEKDFLNRLLSWIEEGKYSHNGKCFDIDQTTKAAVLDFKKSGSPIANTYDPSLTGHGSIVRLAPVAMFFNEDIKSAFDAAARQSRVTHCDPLCLNLCQQMMLDFLNFYRGFSPEQLWKNDMVNKNPNEILPGYVQNTYNAAKWALQTTTNFKDAVLTAVNLRSRDADTVGAVTGQLAGALYGLQGIPTEWVDQLAWKDYILEMVDKIYYEED